MSFASSRKRPVLAALQAGTDRVGQPDRQPSVSVAPSACDIPSNYGVGVLRSADFANAALAARMSAAAPGGSLFLND
jgi:hypothetical protein